MILFLSVGRDVVSLWDTEAERNRSCLRGEIVINMVLTPEQEELLAIAKRAATVDVLTGHYPVFKPVKSCPHCGATGTDADGHLPHFRDCQDA